MQDLIFDNNFLNFKLLFNKICTGKLVLAMHTWNKIFFALLSGLKKSWNLKFKTFESSIHLDENFDSKQQLFWIKVFI